MQVDPFAADFQRNPYPVYEKLRDTEPAHWCAANAWMITRYSDVRLMLADPRLAHWAAAESSSGTPFSGILSRWVRLMEPQNKTHLRALVLERLSQDAVESKREQIRRLAEELLDVKRQSGELDVIGELAEPLTLAVIGDLLGVPPEDGLLFRRRVRELQGGLFGLVAGSNGGERAAAFQSFAAYVHDLVQRKRKHPGDDLISALMQAQARGDDITAEDFFAFTMIFLFAGHDNMMNLIGNGALALLRHPDQWSRLREEPALLRSSVEELLRFDSPVQFVNLVAREEFSVCGKRIRANDSLLVSIGSANRDPRRFSEPDRLDITRSPNPHLSLGAGSMYCVGAALARLQGQVAIGALVRSFDPIGPDLESLRWRSSPAVLRGLVSLPIRHTLGNGSGSTKQVSASDSAKSASDN